MSRRLDAGLRSCAHYRRAGSALRSCPTRQRSSQLRALWGLRGQSLAFALLQGTLSSFGCRSLAYRIGYRAITSDR